MDARQVSARALAVPVAVRLDHVQQVRRRVGRGLGVEHPRKSQRNLKDGPAIQTPEVGGRGLHPVVDLQREPLVRRPGQGQPDAGGALPDG